MASKIKGHTVLHVPTWPGWNGRSFVYVCADCLHPLGIGRGLDGKFIWNDESLEECPGPAERTERHEQIIASAGVWVDEG